jgi:hypothetical protein
MRLDSAQTDGGQRASGARDEFHLAAIVQNPKTMALRLGRPPSWSRVQVDF